MRTIFSFWNVMNRMIQRSYFPLVVKRKRRRRKQMCLHFLSYDSAAGKQNLTSVFCLMMSPRSRSLELLPQQGQEALSLGFQHGGANAVSWR